MVPFAAFYPAENAACYQDALKQALLRRGLPLEKLIVHGEVSDGQLADFQRRCLAQILVHPASSGMLTRLVDASIAGIPIIGNWMGLRSYHHFFEGPLIGSGVFIAHPAVRFAPEKPKQAADALIKALAA
jgi:hypothetical protein